MITHPSKKLFVLLERGSFLFLMLLLSLSSSYSQTPGPGDVPFDGTQNMWLNPTTISIDGSSGKVASWDDASGSSNDISSPTNDALKQTLVTGTLNGNDVLQFDASGGNSNTQYMGVASGLSYSMKNAFVVFCIKPTLAHPTTGNRTGNFFGQKR